MVAPMSIGSAQRLGPPGGAESTGPLRLLDLPPHLLERFLADCGGGAAGAYAACRAARAAWLRALSQPPGAARYLLARHGPSGAEARVYDRPGVLDVMLGSPVAVGHDSRVMALLRNMQRSDSSAVVPPERLREAIRTAALYGHTRVVAYWQSRGVPGIWAALAAAAQHGTAEAVGALLAAVRDGVITWADADAVGGTPCIVADGNARGTAAVRHIITDGVSGGGNAATDFLARVTTELLPHAAKNPDVAVLQALLAAGADPRVGDSEALLLATIRSSEAAVAALLGAGADPLSANGSAAFSDALQQGNAPIVRLLLNAGADPNNPRFEPLQRAVKDGHEDLTRVLLRAGANAQQGFLSTAASLGHAGVVAALLDAGLQPAANNGDALVVAAAAGHAHVVKVLLRRGDSGAGGADGGYGTRGVGGGGAASAGGGAELCLRHTMRALFKAARSGKHPRYAQALAEVSGRRVWLLASQARLFMWLSRWLMFVVPMIAAWIAACLWYGLADDCTGHSVLMRAWRCMGKRPAWRWLELAALGVMAANINIADWFI